MRDTVLEQYLAKMGFLRDDYLTPYTKERMVAELFGIRYINFILNIY